MDNARIQAILASYEDNDSEEIEEKPRSPSPPKNLEEFIETCLPEGMKEWPSAEEIDDLLNLNLTVDSVGLGGLEEIVKDLEKHAPFDTSLLDDVQRQLEELELRFNEYGSQVLSQEPPPNADSLSKHLLSPTSLRALSAQDHADEVINKKDSFKQAKYKVSDDQSNLSKSIQNTTYPGFFPTEMTPLPGQIEAPQLLNNIVKAQTVSPAFRKIFQKLFLSEASVAILQDTFWWFFLNNFKSDSKQAQDGLYNRIADSFVSLFFGVPPQYKDRFFAYYPDCISQGIYAAFCEAFPRSYSLFDDLFKANLLNSASEWMTGTKPPPHTWKQWNYKILEPANIRDLQDNKTESLKVDMSFDIDATLEDAQFPLPKSVKRGTVPQLSASRMLHTSKGPGSESHQIGPGPEFEKVNFNIFGQSPLVSHYLKMKELVGGEGPSIAIGRTEIAKPQQPAPTYKQVLDETKKTSKSRNISYQKVLDASNQESIKIQKQKRNALRKIDKLKTDLALKNQELKIISEKLFDLVSQSDYGSAGFTAKNVSSLDDDEDDE